ncbi:MAG: GH116 family glycosyl-hydrolase [Candidatus Latescibacterota bacterium]
MNRSATSRNIAHELKVSARDLIADAAANFLSGNVPASDFRSGRWSSFSSKDGKTPFSSTQPVILSDGSHLAISPAAGMQTVITWKSGVSGTIRIFGSFEAARGRADVVLEPPSGVEVIGCGCAEEASLPTEIGQAAFGPNIPFDFIRRATVGDEYRFLVSTPENAATGAAEVLLSATVTRVKKLKAKGRMFPAYLPEAVWETFRAEGYTKPVTGIIYRNTPHPPSGLPMGGIDTGGLDIDTAGTLGYTSIFNHTTPVGGPLNTPFLGLSVGEQTWVLTTCKTKSFWNSGPSMPSPDIILQNVMIPEYIDYWGHYPIVNMEYKIKSPVLASLRAWSPFLPGDARASNVPGAMFEVKLTNQTNTDQAGTIAFSFPGFAKHETKNLAIGIGSNRSKNPVLPAPEILREHIEGKLTGVTVNNESWNMSYTLGVLDEKQVQIGGELGIDGRRWASIHNTLPEVRNDDGGSSLAVDFKLKPNDHKVIKLILAWYAPEWEGNGAPGTGGERIKYLGGDRTSGKGFTHMYAARFKTSHEVAEYLAKENNSLLRRIIAWQSTIYNCRNIPGWLADSLINNLYYFADTSFWAQAKPPIGEWCKPEDGIFALGESPRSCFNMNTIPNLAIAGPLVSYLFPELELSNLRAFKAYQLPNGDVPSIFGNYSDVATPLDYGEYQVVMNGANYMEMLDRYWRVTDDDDFFKEFYDSAKKAIEFTFSLRPEYGLSQILAMPSPVPGKANWREWFEDREWKGYVVHPGGYRMAAARMMRVWSARMGDNEFVEKLDKWLAAGEKAMQDHLWTGDHYMAMNEPETGAKLDCIFMPQLNGQLYARMHGLPGVFPEPNVQRTLDLIEQACGLSRLGMPPLYMKPDGSIWDVDSTGYLTSRYIYLNPQVIDIAMTYMYEGRRDLGLDLLRKNLEIYSCKWGYTWDGALGGSGSGDTGEKSVGWDYWQNWILWGSLAALENRDLASPCRPGGLIDRIIKAAESKQLCGTTDALLALIPDSFSTSS